MSARFIIADVFDGIASLPDNSVDLVITSPPFLALRSYLPADHPDKGKEIGSEPTPGEFIDTLLDVVEALDRVLTPHGSIAFELGDSYSGSGGAGGDYSDEGLRAGQNPFDGTAKRTRASGERTAEESTLGVDARNRARRGGNARLSRSDEWPEAKSLCLVPELFRFALAYGFNPLTGRTTERWRVRNVVRWARPNPPVGFLGDKFRPATSDMVVACKSRTRYFDLDAVRHPHQSDPEQYRGNGYSKGRPEGLPGKESMPGNPNGAPPLDYWVIPTAPYKGSHYATFPPTLVVKPIQAMCPERVCRTCGEPSQRITEKTPQYAAFRAQRTEDRISGDYTESEIARGETGSTPMYGHSAPDGPTHVTTGWTDCGHNDWRAGVVLDPFAGSGTTLAVAVGHSRDAIGIDLDERNADLALDRVGALFLTVETLAKETASV